MLATLALAGLTASLSLAPEAASVAPAAPAGEGFRESGGYLHASPAGAAWYFGAPVIAYSWSLGGGYHFARGRRFAAQVGGFFQHIVWTPPDVMHDVRVGPELRIGGSSPRVFGYAVARVGLEHVKEKVLQDPANAQALWARLQDALDGEPDPWFEGEKARVDARQFIPIAVA